MKNIGIALTRGYDRKVIRNIGSRLQQLSYLILVVLLLGGLASCSPGSTSRFEMMGKSMEPNFSDGQVVEVEPIDDISSLQRGDVILFEWDGNSFVKRLIGLPGETIEVGQGFIMIDDKIYDEPYQVNAAYYHQEPVTLGNDEYYVLGDNRNESRDSHSFGPITSEMIKGRVVP